MKKTFVVLTLAFLFSSDALASDNYLDAQLDICSGRKDAADYSFKPWEMERLRETQRYREMARREIDAHPRLSWFSLSDQEKCQAGRSQRQNDNMQRWLDKGSMGIGG